MKRSPRTRMNLKHLRSWDSRVPNHWHHNLDWCVWYVLSKAQRGIKNSWEDYWCNLQRMQDESQVLQFLWNSRFLDEKAIESKGSWQYNRAAEHCETRIFVRKSWSSLQTSRRSEDVWRWSCSPCNSNRYVCFEKAKDWI